MRCQWSVLGVGEGSSWKVLTLTFELNLSHRKIISLSLFKTAKSDFASDDSYQKLVRISPSATEALTIGNDNQVMNVHCYFDLLALDSRVVFSWPY